MTGRSRLARRTSAIGSVMGPSPHSATRPSSAHGHARIRAFVTCLGEPARLVERGGAVREDEPVRAVEEARVEVQPEAMTRFGSKTSRIIRALFDEVVARPSRENAAPSMIGSSDRSPRDREMLSWKVCLRVEIGFRSLGRPVQFVRVGAGDGPPSAVRRISPRAGEISAAFPIARHPMPVLPWRRGMRRGRGAGVAPGFVPTRIPARFASLGQGCAPKPTVTRQGPGVGSFRDGME